MVIRQGSGRTWGSAVLGLGLLLGGSPPLLALPGSQEPPEASPAEEDEAPPPAPPARTPWSEPRAVAPPRQDALPARPQPAPTTAPRSNAGYDQGFYIRSDDGRYQLKTQARLQVLYQLDCVDVGDDRCLENLTLPRASLTFSGTALARTLRYNFQAEFGKGLVYLKDYYLDAQLLPGALHLRIGQFKRPFSRQQINSDSKLEVVDRSPLDKFSESGRDIGLMLHDDYEKSPGVEWAFGVFDGTGVLPHVEGQVATDPHTGRPAVTQGTMTDVPRRYLPALVLRLGWNEGGIAGYSEADLEGGPLRFGLAASTLVELDADRNDSAASRAEADYVVKAHGFSTTGGLYLQSMRPGSGPGKMDFQGWGAFAQAGYLLAGRWEPTARYSRLQPDRRGARQVQYSLGLSLYLARHELKWQTELAVGNLVEPEQQMNEYIARSQLQLGF